jgi:F420-0:gamma-glutamyl ligase
VTLVRRPVERLGHDLRALPGIPRITAGDDLGALITQAAGGNPMWVELNRVDELAGAASALMGQSSAARPVVVLLRGAHYTPDENASIRRLLVQPDLPETDADLVSQSESPQHK